MASPFSLSGKKKEKAGGGDYSALLKKNMARYKDRDEAVRKTNIASGYGNSTAQRHMHEGGGKAKSGGGGGGGGGGKTDRRKTSSTKKRGNFSLPETAPIPTPRSFGSPDLAVSPQHPADPMARSAPTNNPMLSPDLPVSPQHPADPMAAGAPTSGLPPPMMPPLGGVPPDLMPPPFPPDMAVSPQFPQNNNMMQTAPQNGLHIGAPPRPVVGSGGPVGAGNPLISTPPADDNASWIRKLLGLA
jgi:hypothetical protein